MTRKTTFQITRAEAAVLMDMLPVWLDVSRTTTDPKSGLKLPEHSHGVLQGLSDALTSQFVSETAKENN